MKSKNEKYNKKQIEALNVDQEIRTYEERLQEQRQEIDERINRKETSFIPLAQYKTDTDKSLYDYMQSFLDYDFLDKEKYRGKQQIQSGMVTYEDKTHITKVVFEGQFDVLGNYSYTAQTEKIKDALEERLVTQYIETPRPTIYITIKELASEISVNASDLRKRIDYILESLKTIRISYKTKGKLKKIDTEAFKDFGDIRIISSSEYKSDTDILEVSFDDRYAFKLATNNFYQLPKKYRQMNDNAYPYAYHLAKYVFELCREGRSSIKFSSLYERIKKIPRIEKLKEHKNSPTQKIYEPLVKCFKELNSKGDFTIEFKNEDFLLQGNSRKNLDFDKMLDTDITIKWNNKPNYENIEKTREQYARKLLNEQARLIARATMQNVIEEPKHPRGKKKK